MAKKPNIDLLKHEYNNLNDGYENFCQEIVRQLSHLIKEANVTPAVPIQFRVKKWESILDKIEQKRFTIKKEITELQDLAGIRIILLFTRDLQKIKELIKANFRVLKEYNSEDKLNEDQFGYSSTHFSVELIDEWLKTPTLSKFKAMKLEIQLRTLSQHSWAEASQNLQYKQEDNVPKPLKRSISRISALLEMVDLEYERLLHERDIYKTQIKEVGTEQKDSELNVDLLEQLLDTYLPEKNKSRQENYSELLDNLQALGYKTTSKTIELINKNIAEAIDLDQKIAVDMHANYVNKKNFSTKFNYQGSNKDLSRITQGVFLSHVGIIRLMLTQELGRPWNHVIQDLTNKKV